MQNPNTDWLVQALRTRAAVSRRADGKEITLSNGLIRRVFRLAPNAATVALDNLMTGASMLRAVKPEASVVLDGVHYDIGGLVGQPDLAYLRPEWLDAMRPDLNAFQFVRAETGKTKERFPWKR